MGERAIRVGMIGCGVVGQGVLQLLRGTGSLIERRLGRAIEVRRIAVRDLGKPRPNVPPELLATDVEAVIDDPDVDVVVEVMGGVEPADAHVRRAIRAGKQVVTANKALLAERGSELLDLAERSGVDLYFEAAVAGGIPIIRLLREALASDRVVSVRGILNGTSNYILSRMSQEGMSLDDALAEAQREGYAEADPALDLSGGDAAHKLTILATLAFGASAITPDEVATEGIEGVTAVDIEFARRFGYAIKPLAVARMTDDGALELRVHPALVPQGSMLAALPGALNAVRVDGAMLGPCLTSGPGAGALPTAMSVVSDIVDVGRNLVVGVQGRVPPRAFRAASLEALVVQDVGDHRTRYFMRFAVEDRPGNLAQITQVLADRGISIEQMAQDGTGEGRAAATVVLLTHEATERAARAALGEIAALGSVSEPPQAIRIEPL